MFFKQSLLYSFLISASCCIPVSRLAACEVSKFTKIKKVYFDSLGDTSHRGNTVRKSLDLLATKCANEYKTSNHKPLVGEILIFDALLKINDTQAKQDSKKGHLANTGQILKAIDNLKLARELRPNDKRIPGWLQGAKATLYRIQGEPIKDQILQKAVAAIDARPTFNLWTAILIFRDQDPNREPFEQLLSKAKDFADLMRGSDNPCLKLPTDCQNSPAAPNNFSSAIYTLADVFIRASNKRLHQGNIPEAMMFAGYAKGTLGNISSQPNPLLEYRMGLVASLFNRQRFADAELLANDRYHQPYTCKACHSK